MFTLAAISAWFISNKRTIIYMGLAILILIIAISTYQCTKKEVRYDYETINKINSQNEKESKQAIREVIEANAESIKTIDERNTLSDEQIEFKQREVDKKVEQISKEIEYSKSQHGNVSGEELECLLVPENCNK